jgi:hypothetical protein
VSAAKPPLTVPAYACCCCCTMVPTVIVPLLLLAAFEYRGISGGAGERTVGTKVGLGDIDPQAVCNDGDSCSHPPVHPARLI